MAFIFRYNLILNKTDLKHCDKKSVENDEPLELNMLFFSFFLSPFLVENNFHATQKSSP